MFLKKLKLTNFRNYAALDHQFKSEITVLIGDNAQGKTNFLESIVFLATTKSPKAQKDEELIKEGETVLHVEGSLENKTQLEISMSQETTGDITSLKKRVKVNGIARRSIDYAENVVVVLFAPEDINLVAGSPSLRRNYLDSMLSQLDRKYKKALSDYEQVITRKNRILKAIRESSANLEELRFWVERQLEFAEILIKKRQDFFNFISQGEKKFGKFEYHYHPSLISLELLQEHQRREIESATSLIGPHRDDFSFYFEEKNLSKYGSRGEQRTAVLDLKIAEVEYVQHILESRPILLLDDIFSELDENHRQHVIDLAKLQQTIISTVEWDDYLKSQLKKSSLFTVENAILTPVP